VPGKVQRVAVAILSSVLLTAWWPFSRLDWPSLTAKIRAEYPAVRQLSTAELAVLQGDPPRAQPVLIDTRSADEFAISHLRGAIRAETADEAIKVLAQAPTDRSVVLYCSVGYRSSKLADELGKRGYRNLSNLEGSIFAWANEGRAVFRGNDEVREVHPYNNRWGALLDRALWPKGRWTAR
jgi:rhodanese-related sulfurtransferase